MKAKNPSKQELLKMNPQSVINRKNFIKRLKAHCNGSDLIQHEGFDYWKPIVMLKNGDKQVCVIFHEPIDGRGTYIDVTTEPLTDSEQFETVKDALIETLRRLL